MAGVLVQTLTVELRGAKHEFPTLSFPDRRARVAKTKTWVLVRGIERVLFGVQEGGRSTGAFAAHLSGATMKSAVLVCAKATVQEGTLMQEELDAGA